MNKLLKWFEEIEIKKTSSAFTKNARYTRYNGTNHRKHKVKCVIEGNQVLSTKLGTDEAMVHSSVQPQAAKTEGLSGTVPLYRVYRAKIVLLLEKIKTLLPGSSEEEINYYYDLLEERAGTLEYDAGYTREEAEKQAIEEIKQLCKERNQTIESVIKYMENLNSALIPFTRVNEGHIKGISSVSELRGLKIPNIEISFLPDDSVEITKLTDKPCKVFDESANKHLKLKNFILDRQKKKEFIDEHDLELYHDEAINRITFKAQVYKGGGRLGIVNIFFVSVAFNKRALTHQVSKTGLILISMPTGYNDKKLKLGDFVQVTGKTKTTNCYEIGEIVYIKTDKIKLLKKGLK